MFLLLSISILFFNTEAKIKALGGQTVSNQDLSDPLVKTELLAKFKVEYKDKKKMVKLQKEVLVYAGKAVGALVEVMKNGKYPQKNRWIATFLLGKIMGKKSSPFLVKFFKHPSWFMRMASLKTLLALKDNRFPAEYAKLLKDDSFLVRYQALDTIGKLKLTKIGENVWAMLYDKKNYYNPKKSKLKRTNIVKKIIATVGDIEFKKARKPLLSMIQKKKYDDIFSEMEYALSKLTHKKIPKGSLKLKRRFWSKIALNYTTI